MTTIFDLLSVLLFIATAGLFLVRFRHEDPPLAPYLAIALVCVVGAWLGNHGGGAAAVGLLIAAAFLTLHLASEPYREDPEEQN
ncbi:XrtV sorting system accessory protein [Hyphococcus sp.]|uniref:XrtV sorting system accessory protein n=1 Tax=Hyphococcus sp. TaxID=2038636 RepID=UPI003D143D48